MILSRPIEKRIRRDLRDTRVVLRRAGADLILTYFAEAFARDTVRD
ncbi:MAG: hypothetical protein ACK5VI_11465 [Opitutia bacterium]|jgi:delta-aminolevulinic acid dehydratase/porphobilinogen synthase